MGDMADHILPLLTQCHSFALRALNTILTEARPYQVQGIDIIVACALAWIILKWLHTSRKRVHTTRLRGPPSESFLYGVGKLIRGAKDSGSLYEAWAREYGPVFAAPSTLGRERIVLCDPKAIAHFHSKETLTYIQTPLTKESFRLLYGKGLLWAHGEDHKRQRKSLAPGFGIPAIRQLMPTFYDTAYKAKLAWDLIIESSGEVGAIVEAQSWMNHMALDNVGLACFSHDFRSLEGKHSAVTEILDAFSTTPLATVLNKTILLLAQEFPILARIPTSRSKLLHKLNIAMTEISNAIVSQARRELENSVSKGKEEKSVIGLLIKSASDNLTMEEITAQMKVLLVAGYETTAITLTWALLDLSRNPDVQTILRDELLNHGTDPTYDEFANSLPYLDAVVHEILRVHLPIVELTRVADKNDIIPLSEPVCTMSGDLVDSLTIAKGTLITVSLECINRSNEIWGDDAKIFRPDRWLEDAHGFDRIPAKAKQIRGYRHLLSFVDGPRACPGRHFALAELKVVLTVLVKNFVFELRDGIDSKIDIGRGVFPRPKIYGEVGCKLPLRVRQYKNT